MAWIYTKWYELALVLPDDEMKVWLRLDRWSGTPFVATYDATAQIFINDENSMEVPAYMVSRFRPFV